MSWVSMVGFAAALCSTINFVPQAVRIVRTRDTKSLSAPMYALTTTGFCLWSPTGSRWGNGP
ncbi:PQ-loop domain-containing transporter [Bosea vestrisii]|uniref:SemiSWEET family sugar transporter n=1 Tax=Bosea vestrisii TaxID=151416 RepID=UPI0024DFB2A5|nr:PQ-loop domain-containing transporter [Bosea vestrisii]WID94138.1 PQ-loop domain-containing transporter [Bosea vestrisii]